MEEALVWKIVITKISDESNTDPYLNIQDLDYTKEADKSALEKSKSKNDSELSPSLKLDDSFKRKSAPAAELVKSRTFKLEEEALDAVKGKDESNVMGD